MRPPRLIFLLFCFIFLPIFLTFFSFSFSSPRVTTPNALAGRTGGLHALFSFNIPSSLFPPSAVISLTDDNSTFFLSRPAAFGPLLPAKGLSGQIWVGSGFGEGGVTTGIEGELGCSDIPGWGEVDSHRKPDKLNQAIEKTSGKSVTALVNNPARSQNRRRTDTQQDPKSQNNDDDHASPPSKNDGTDDHLHHPLPESDVPDTGASEKHGDHSQNRPPAHADIQSLQESAEIAGKIVLLSRGGCGFLEKVKWVQRRGGIALIVGDDTRGGSLVTMYARGDTSNVTIPAVFTSHTTAHLLSSLIPPQNRKDPSLNDGLKASDTKLTGNGNSAKQGSGSTTTTASAVPSPTSTSRSSVSGQGKHVSKPKSGVFHAIFSLLGFGGDNGRSWHVPEDSRRPPSSGNIDWVRMDTWDDEDTLSDDSKPSTENSRTRTREKSDDISEELKSPGSKTSSDNFIIGVQDWRDPDLVAPKSSSVPKPSSVSGKEKASSQNGDKGFLMGGSITPGSGEYQSVDRSSSKNKESAVKATSNHAATETDDQGDAASGRGWFSSHFGWGDDSETESDRFSRSRLHGHSTAGKSHKSSSSAKEQGVHNTEHEGLWVTLTPTSMSTSPFFDTLLVLVISPLLTLTVVYALLLLRSRIRRRRWRAPKSVVDRLPVRTYHTISPSSSATSSPRSSSPGSSSPTSPLLTSGSRSGVSRCRPRSQTTSGIISNSPEPLKEAESSQGEKSGSDSTLWRRKYTGRQVECVVCLEEYVDGQSRVMSLPCGHEFHAECITPWLTTRRRTCPICKGDVVRSMAQHRSAELRDQEGEALEEAQTRELESLHGASSAPVPISPLSEDELSDMEHQAGPEVSLLDGHSTSAPESSWRNFASLSFSVLSGDTIWHQARAGRNR